jgi:hypothetical protein
MQLVLGLGANAEDPRIAFPAAGSEGDASGDLSQQHRRWL